MRSRLKTHEPVWKEKTVAERSMATVAFNRHVDESWTHFSLHRNQHRRVASLFMRLWPVSVRVPVILFRRRSLSTVFCPLSVVDVVAAVRALPHKQCTYLVPIKVLKSNTEREIDGTIRRGTAQACRQSSSNHLQVSLHYTSVEECRLSPIGIVETLDHLISSRDNHSTVPSVVNLYRAHHSTESTVQNVLGDILRAVDSCNLALLTLLDLSTAFDTVDHVTLLRHLEVSYGNSGTERTVYRGHNWQCVRSGSINSTPIAVLFRVPQGSNCILLTCHLWPNRDTCATVTSLY